MIHVDKNELFLSLPDSHLQYIMEENEYRNYLAQFLELIFEQTEKMKDFDKNEKYQYAKDLLDEKMDIIQREMNVHLNKTLLHTNKGLFRIQPGTLRGHLMTEIRYQYLSW